MCVLVTFDINLVVMENSLHDHRESGVIKYAWTSTILGIYKYGFWIASEVLAHRDAADLEDNVFNI